MPSDLVQELAEVAYAQMTVFTLQGIHPDVEHADAIKTFMAERFTDVIRVYLQRQLINVGN